MRSRPKSKPRLRAVLYSFFAAAFMVGGAACTPAIEQRGNLLDVDKLASVEPGLSQDDVQDMLGSPSSKATFGEETWYYIATRIETLAFYEPVVLEQQVVAVAFDKDGTVESVRRYGLDDARAIELVDRTTPTGGRRLTLLQQLLGNLGRFPAQQSEGGY